MKGESDVSSSPQQRVLRVTLVYEYKVNPAHYPNGDDPYEMAMVDIETDPTVILDTEWTIERAVFHE